MIKLLYAREGIAKFICDHIEEIANLPTDTIQSDITGGCVAMGSECLCIGNGKTYIMDGYGIWSTTTESSARSIRIYKDENTTISILDGTTSLTEESTVADGTSVAISTSYDNGYEKNELIINGVNKVEEVEPITMEIHGNMIVICNAKVSTYDITYMDGISVVEGLLPSKYTFSIGCLLPDTTKIGYNFDGWYDSIDFTGDPLTEILDTAYGDKTLYAKFTAITYDLVRESANATITVKRNNIDVADGVDVISYNDELVISIVADEGYTVESVAINGVIYDIAENYVVNGDTSITATVVEM